MKFGVTMQNDMPMANQNRKYNFNISAVRFPKPEVVITQPWIEISL